ncbi:MAG: DsbA family protein [Terriglobales bacterium]
MKPVALSLLLLGTALLALAVAPHPTADADPVVGNVHSKLRVIVYQDLECPDCARWHQVFNSHIIPQFGRQVAFEFRDFPLPQHLWSFNAAVLARFFDTHSLKLGMAWRDYCFTHQDALTPDNLMDTAARWAHTSGITRAQLASAFSNAELFARVQADQRRGIQDNVQHTPTVLFEGVEASTPQQLELRLAQALAAH